MKAFLHIWIISSIIATVTWTLLYAVFGIHSLVVAGILGLVSSIVYGHMYYRKHNR